MRASNQRYKDISGQRFGRLVALQFEERNPKGKAVWLFRCDCGNEVKIVGENVTRGYTNSCGCLKAEREKCIRDENGELITSHPLYTTWCNMKTRCTNPNFAQAKDYQGRGITVCDEWMHDYVAFYFWARANGWAPGLTLDRIDNNKGYSPDNCRWVTRGVQNRNTRNNIIVEYDGKSQVLKDHCTDLGLSYTTVIDRVEHGWDPIEAIETPKLKTFRGNQYIKPEFPHKSHPMYQSWSRGRREKILIPEWHDEFKEFIKGIEVAGWKDKSQAIRRIDSSKPFGPDNIRIVPNTKYKPKE